MDLLIAFLLGFLLGGVFVRALVLRAARRFLGPHPMGEQYSAARQAVARHLTAHGTLNLAQLRHLTDAPARTAQRYLKEMEREGLVHAQRHHGSGRFYTRS